MNSNVKQVSSIVLFNTIVFYILLQTCNKPGDWGEKPLSNQDALYFISTTMSTAGYGDITPKSDRAKRIVMIFHFTMLIELYSFVLNKFT